jgi:hypothetical protein
MLEGANLWLDYITTFCYSQDVFYNKTQLKGNIMNLQEETTVRALRLPISLVAWLKTAAQDNGRTFRGEVIYRLEKSKNND